MSQMIESMESATLFSASAAVITQDLAALKAAQVKAKADLTSGFSAVIADAKAVKGDVAAAHPTTAQKQLLITLAKDEKAAVAKFKKSILGLLASGARDGTHLVPLLKNLQAHPSDAGAQSKVQAGVTTLQGVFSPQVVTAIETSAAATVAGVNTDLDAIAASVPSAQANVTAAKTHLATDLETLATEATGIQTAIATLAADLA